jgi:hypothetical protein
MRDFAGAVAVITGAACGIGLALAQGALARGAYVVIAGIRDEPLAQTATDLTAAAGAVSVLAVRTQVSHADDIEALAGAAVARFGKLNLMFNNAGVFASGLTWTTSLVLPNITDKTSQAGPSRSAARRRPTPILSSSRASSPLSRKHDRPTQRRTDDRPRIRNPDPAPVRNLSILRKDSHSAGHQGAGLAGVRSAGYPAQA